MKLFPLVVTLVSFLCFTQGEKEPDYVVNLGKYFDEDPYSGTYYRKIASVDDLESTSKDVLRTFLKDKQEDVEKFFNEWKNTYSNGGPFETKRQLKKLYKELTKPNDFRTALAMEGLLDNRDDSKAAKKAFKQAFVSRDDAKVMLFYVGDADIMSGVLVAGVRKNLDATFVVFVTD